MRLPEEQIKAAIMHPETEVRYVAVRYWADSHTEDTSVMPKVIEAVERYGRHESFTILRCAERLPQSGQTVEWLMEELRRDYDLDDPNDDNHCCAVALILLKADPEQLIPRHKEIIGLPTIIDKLKEGLDLRLKFHFSGWDSCWQAFLDTGREAFEDNAITHDHLVRFHMTTEAMATHRAEGERIVLDMLRHQYKREQRELVKFVESMLIMAAGKMRLEKAVPLLMKRLYTESYDIIDELGPALSKIGTDSVIQAVNQAWWDADHEQRSVLCEPLENIHSDLAAERAYEFYHREEDFDIQLSLAHCLLSHFDSRGIEVGRDLVLGDDDELEGDQWDVRWRLIAVATIMGEHFPEYERWHKDAVETNYGHVNMGPPRLGRSLRGDFED